MKFFFPDSQDLVDPSFDFYTECRSPHRLRHRDDLYAHELFSSRVADGLLISKGIVDGIGGAGGRYTLAQRQRLLRGGVREFLRVSDRHGEELPIMGDCGAFTYVRETTPPYSVDDVLTFYEECQFDLGTSVDHVVLAYQPSWDDSGSVPAEIRFRQEVTLTMAAEFLREHHRRKYRFTPLGVAQGWSPKSYGKAVQDLQTMGYQYIALGGMVPLKTHEILMTLETIAGVRRPDTKLHLLGVTRTEQVNEFGRFGVVSFDSTSPLLQAFKDDKDNYYTLDRTYTAIRVPQVEGNPRLQRQIRSGKISQDEARRLEKECLFLLRSYSEGATSLDDVLRLLREYENVYDPKHDHTDAYREILEDQPWKQCGCDVCTSIDYHVALFRGAERNRRRGFHNIWTFYRRLRRELGRTLEDIRRDDIGETKHRVNAVTTVGL